MIGAGYVGLVTGACLADFGHDVICVDNDPAKIEALRNGKIPIYEPGLDELIARNSDKNRLIFTTHIDHAVSSADVVFVAVGTPSRNADGAADMSYVHKVVCDIAKHLSGYTTVVMKSTAAVGTGDEVERLMIEANPDAEFSVVSNPEFLREGSAIRDFKFPDRIVVGTQDEQAKKAMQEVYRPLYINESPVFFTTRRTSELTKYAANAFLAMKITFINEIADLCEMTGANVQEVARGIGLDKRIGTKFLHAGPGFGGSCFPKDTRALAMLAQNFDRPLRLVETTIAINDQRKRTIARKVISVLGGSVRGKSIAILGLTFKPNTDDMRDSPAISIIQLLQDNGAKIRAYDPEGMTAAKAHLSEVEYFENPYVAMDGADATVIVTEWEEFRALDLDKLKKIMKQAVLVDLRNIYRRDEVEQHGIKYVDVGRQSDTY